MYIEQNVYAQDGNFLQALHDEGPPHMLGYQIMMKRLQKSTRLTSVPERLLKYTAL
jgi:hypothetical protein